MILFISVIYQFQKEGLQQMLLRLHNVSNANEFLFNQAEKRK